MQNLLWGKRWQQQRRIRKVNVNMMAVEEKPKNEDVKEKQNERREKPKRDEERESVKQRKREEDKKIISEIPHMIFFKHL